MEYKSVKGFTGWAQLGFLFAFLGLGFILAGGVQYFISLKMTPSISLVKDTSALMKIMLAPQNINLVRASQVLGTMMLLFVPALLWSYVSNGKNMFWLGFNKYLNVWQIFAGFLIMYAAALAAAPLQDITKSIVAYFPAINNAALQMEHEYNEQVVALSNLKNWPEYFLALVIMAFCPALFEEVFFRGVVQNLFIKWWKAPLTGIFISAFIFSLIHNSIYLFASRLLLGYVLGLMYYYTKNIWINIIAHFLNNAVALTILFKSGLRHEIIDPQKLDPPVHWTIGLAGVAALVVLFIWLQKLSVINKAKIEAKENLLLVAENPFGSFSNNKTNMHGVK